MSNIPLVKRETFNYFSNLLDQLLTSEPELLESLAFTYPVRPSESEYRPQIELGELLIKFHRALQHDQFVETIKKEAKTIVANQIDKLNGQYSLQFLKSHSAYNQMSLTSTDYGIWVSIDSLNFSAAASKITLEEELLTLFFIEASFTQLLGKELVIKGFKITKGDASLLRQFKLPNNVPLYIERKSAGILMEGDRGAIDTLAKTFPSNPPITYAKNIEYALESYIGEQNFSLQDFSDLVGISCRTIQRRLQNEGTSFRKIKDTLNVKFAKTLLYKNKISIENIAAQLGYAAPSQFIRAFKRSEGLSPLRWLESQRH
ncbi:helix-turn-helix domain-containing protein [Vibrio sp. VB16]|uniref:helix-turn-helix domain-containing protein n=1 Tax=Vibrio sp. VB16 TaxID=2785746 RepID=UPI0018A0F769|nr:AraC family transcriptional regulator [Vibrio sp. VB16]UGA53586.1 AraC family transcriptional regulator [Vibrio sp. VB16]